MDPIMLAALLAFAVLVISWLVLPVPALAHDEAAEQPATSLTPQGIAQAL